jgi:hypothetical protein
LLRLSECSRCSEEQPIRPRRTCDADASPFQNERTVPSGQRMIMQIALRDGLESTNVASPQRLLKGDGHRDRFKGFEGLR